MVRRQASRQSALGLPLRAWSADVMLRLMIGSTSFTARLPKSQSRVGKSGLVKNPINKQPFTPERTLRTQETA